MKIKLAKIYFTSGRDTKKGMSSLNFGKRFINDLSVTFTYKNDLNKQKNIFKK